MSLVVNLDPWDLVPDKISQYYYFTRDPRRDWHSRPKRFLLSQSMYSSLASVGKKVCGVDVFVQDMHILSDSQILSVMLKMWERISAVSQSSLNSEQRDTLLYI